jgi:hypothetical protein
VPCPTCGQAAEFQGYRDRQPLSLFGPIHCTRAYYCCHRCSKGLCPWDQEVGLTAKRLTPAAERVVSLAGLLADSFAEAAEKILPELSGLSVGESTAQRTTEAAGRRLADCLEQGHTLGRPAAWEWHQDAHGRRCAYVAADAVSVPQQAPGGGAAESRMPYVAMVYNPVPEPAAAGAAPKPPMQARYLAGLLSLDQLGLRLRKQAGQVGMEAADLWIALSDGGAGLEDFFRTNFNRADLVVILDFWHAATYLEELALALPPGDAGSSQALTQAWCQTMKRRGGAGILEQLRALGKPRGRAAAEKYKDATTYLENQQHRMDYPHYLAQGWQIGSGPVESACKTVVGQRLKLAGMRWGEDGTDEMCHLRALFKSDRGQWLAFWERNIN